MDNFAALLTLLKSFLGIAETDRSRDVELTAYLNASIKLCETYIDDKISRSEVQTSFTWGYAPFLLPYSKADTLSAVTCDGEDVLAQWEIIASSWFAHLCPVDRYRYCLDGEELVASYSAGYTTVPDDLLLAIAYGAVALESQHEDGVTPSQVAREMVTGVGTVEYDLDSTVGILPPRATQILDLHRRVSV